MAPFDRRTYSLTQFGKESIEVALDFKTAASALAGISPAFRERIMLAVTGENHCRYCAFVHTRAGVACGLTQTEVDKTLEGDFSLAPDDERPALEFARGWAKRDADEDPAEKTTLVERYGQPRAEQIEMCCRLIRLGNLTGNTLDSVLFKMSGGRLGD